MNKVSILSRAVLVLSLVLASGSVQAQSLDELHKSALKEGGTINFYATLAQINAETTRLKRSEQGVGA